MRARAALLAVAIVAIPMAGGADDGGAPTSATNRMTTDGYRPDQMTWSLLNGSDAIRSFDPSAAPSDPVFTKPFDGLPDETPQRRTPGFHIGWNDGQTPSGASSPPALRPSVIRPGIGTEQVIGTTDDPALTADGHTLAGSGGSNLTPACTGKPPTNNSLAVDFANRYPAVFRSIAAIIQKQGSRSVLIGTAVVVASDVVVTAAHIVDYLNGNQRHIVGAGAVVDSSFVLVFDLTLDRFPTGLPDDLDWPKEAGAFAIPAGAVTFSDTTLDIGALRVKIPGRNPMTLSSVAAKLGDEFNIVGIPGEYTDKDGGTYALYNQNYAICGLPTATTEYKIPVVIRVGAGKFIKSENNGNKLDYAVDTLGGDSGAPVFYHADGTIAAINAYTVIDYAIDATEKYNSGVPAAALLKLLAAMPAPIAVSPPAARHPYYASSR